jgi:hypothetical protein
MFTFAIMAALASACLATSAAAAPSTKVEVCHIPPDDPGSFHTIRVPEKAFAKHLNHGDLAGPCNDVCATLCDDGNACTIDDTGDCETDGCPASPEPVDCNDSNACTADSCDPSTGCEYVPLTGTSCTASNPGTCEEPTGVCSSAGACEPDRTPDCCLSTTECEAWDTNLCTNEECIATECVTTSTVSCETDACHISVCVESTGECTVPQDIVCPNLECHDNGCNPETGCYSDVIEGCCISDSECDDGYNCTTDTCLGVDGCTNTPCASGDACNVLVDCDPLTCAPYTTPVTCADDGDPCTVELCVDGLGCVSDPLCSDGEVCNATTGTCEPVCFTMRDGAGSGGSVQECVDLCNSIAGCSAGVCDQKFQNAALVDDCLINGNLTSCDAIDDNGRDFCTNICLPPPTAGNPDMVLCGNSNCDRHDSSTGARIERFLTGGVTGYLRAFTPNGEMWQIERLPYGSHFAVHRYLLDGTVLSSVQHDYTAEAPTLVAMHTGDVYWAGADGYIHNRGAIYKFDPTAETFNGVVGREDECGYYDYIFRIPPDLSDLDKEEVYAMGQASNGSEIWKVDLNDTDGDGVYCTETVLNLSTYLPGTQTPWVRNIRQAPNGSTIILVGDPSIPNPGLHRISGGESVLLRASTYADEIHDFDVGPEDGLIYALVGAFVGDTMRILKLDPETGEELGTLPGYVRDPSIGGYRPTLDFLP